MMNGNGNGNSNCVRFIISERREALASLSSFFIQHSSFTLCRFAANILRAESAKMIQFRAAHFSFGYKIYLRNTWRVDREDTLDAYAIRDLADGHRFVQSRAATRDHDALEMLDALFIALDDANRHVNDVPRAKLWNILANLSKIDGVYDLFHGRKVRIMFVLQDN
jgi:hypothetical protein